jgi:hypothetical protein
VVYRGPSVGIVHRVHFAKGQGLSARRAELSRNVEDSHAVKRLGARRPKDWSSEKVEERGAGAVALVVPVKIQERGGRYAIPDLGQLGLSRFRRPLDRHAIIDKPVPEVRDSGLSPLRLSFPHPRLPSCK